MSDPSDEARRLVDDHMCECMRSMSIGASWRDAQEALLAYIAQIEADEREWREKVRHAAEQLSAGAKEMDRAAERFADLEQQLDEGDRLLGEIDDKLMDAGAPPNKGVRADIQRHLARRRSDG